jgi:2-methylcitrate dehydratase PrpD
VASTEISTRTSGLADFASGLSAADVPAQGMDLVNFAVLDSIGCALAAATSPERERVLAWASRLGTAPDSTVIGPSAHRLPAALAAMVNATAAHALDLDDVSPTMNHPSACLVPALLAVGERIGSSGRDLQLGYVAGFEVCARLCRILNPEHYHDGWHTTGTVNTLGVAAAVGRLLGLTTTQLRMALGIAAASASGLRKNFGSMVKPLHAGNAAFHGVAAAELAADGFTADADVLDGRLGYLDVFGRGRELVVTPSAELELLTSGITFKRFACCGALHTAIDGLLDIMDGSGIRGADIARITCSVNTRAAQILVYDHAETPAQGRFCVQYSLAVAGLDGAAGPEQYADGRVQSHDVQELSARVQVAVDEALPTGYATFPSIVAVETRDGRRAERRVDVAIGEPGRPFSRAEMTAKFRTCAGSVLLAAPIDRITETVLALGDVGNVRDVAALLAVG